MNFEWKPRLTPRKFCHFNCLIKISCYSLATKVFPLLTIKGLSNTLYRQATCVISIALNLISLLQYCYWLYYGITSYSIIYISIQSVDSTIYGAVVRDSWYLNASVRPIYTLSVYSAGECIFTCNLDETQMGQDILH